MRIGGLQLGGNGTVVRCSLVGNGNGVPDECATDFDGDGIIDSCDGDIDDDVPNDGDVCDFTPPGAPIQPDGSVRSDLDGDCDVDLHDFAILQTEFSGAN